MQEFTENIVNALDLVPEMNEKKKRNESHLKIIERLTKTIEARKLGKFTMVETTLLQGDSLP